MKFYLEIDTDMKYIYTKSQIQTRGREKINFGWIVSYSQIKLSMNLRFGEDVFHVCTSSNVL